MRYRPKRRAGGVDLDLAGFAQEFLRRNPDYLHDYRKLTVRNGRNLPQEEQEDMARKWGLSFPLQA